MESIGPITVADYYRAHPQETDTIRRKAIEHAKKLAKESNTSESYSVQEVIFDAHTNGGLKFKHYGLLIGNDILDLQWKYDMDQIVGVTALLRGTTSEWLRKRRTRYVGETKYSPAIAHSIGTRNLRSNC